MVKECEQDEKQYAVFEGFSKEHEEIHGEPYAILRHVQDGKPLTQNWITRDGQIIEPVVIIPRSILLHRGRQLFWQGIYPSQCEAALAAMNARLAQEHHTECQEAAGNVHTLYPTQSADIG